MQSYIQANICLISFPLNNNQKVLLCRDRFSCWTLVWFSLIGNVSFSVLWTFNVRQRWIVIESKIETSKKLAKMWFKSMSDFSFNASQSKQISWSECNWRVHLFRIYLRNAWGSIKIIRLKLYLMCLYTYKYCIHTNKFINTRKEEQNIDWYNKCTAQWHIIDQSMRIVMEFHTTVEKLCSFILIFFLSMKNFFVESKLKCSLNVANNIKWADFIFSSFFSIPWKDLS